MPTAPRRRRAMVAALFAALATATLVGGAPTNADPVSSPPGAAIITSEVSAEQLAAAIESTPGSITSAELEHVPDGRAVAVSTTPLAGFPTDGDSYAILSTGQAADITLPNDTDDLSTDFDGPNVRGNTDFDVTVLRLDFTAPEDANCLLGIDFRFLTEEYPEFVGSEFNDAFIVELDESTWTTVDSDIVAPGNIAFDPSGSEISVNAAGVTSVRPELAAGTTYNGATPILRASAPLTPGPHSLYLSLFDQGDRIYDSTVLVDNLRVGTVADPADCAPGAEVAQPTASFTATPESGTAPLEVAFDASASTDADGTIEAYDWNFGNGQTGTGVTASTTYTEPGEYTVTLTVTDDGGLTGTATSTVTVGEVAPPPPPPPASGDLVSITVTRGLDYVLEGAATDGDIAIGRDEFGVTSVTGAVTVPSASGGDATVRIDVHRAWILPYYVGSVSVEDPEAAVSLEVPVLFRSLAVSDDPLTVSSNSKWFVFRPPFTFKGITLDWSVTDVPASGGGDASS